MLLFLIIYLSSQKVGHFNLLPELQIDLQIYTAIKESFSTHTYVFGSLSARSINITSYELKINYK
jgi:hypothetical protein